MRIAEERAFASGVRAEDLMDAAGFGIASIIQVTMGMPPGQTVVFVGKGNNGGDALVAAEHFIDWGWDVVFVLPYPVTELAPLPRKKLTKLSGTATFAPLGSIEDSLQSTRPRGRSLVLIDGLLGTGAGGDLRPPIREACRTLNRIRRLQGATTVALDLPTGLDGTSGKPAPDAVEADLTITIGFPKPGLVADEAIDHVGRLALVPLDGVAHGKSETDAVLSSSRNLLDPRGRRPYSYHKGDAGRIGILAGSRGMTGAAALCAAGALRAGGGLITLYVPEDAYPIAASQAPHEVMVSPLSSYSEVLPERHDVLALGPGLGAEQADDALSCLDSFTGPAIIDADALNALANRGGDIPCGPGGESLRLLTPHPGEMRRLIGDRALGDRKTCAMEYVSEKPNVVLLLKGARTIVTTSGLPPAFNPTGHPGMATGGMGDVLTGICAALAVRSTSATDLYEAARLGAWLSGRAAERALRDGLESPESLTASDILSHLGGAFGDFSNSAF